MRIKSILCLNIDVLSKVEEINHKNICEFLKENEVDALGVTSFVDLKYFDPHESICKSLKINPVYGLNINIKEEEETNYEVKNNLVYAFLDLETTGLNHDWDDILEIFISKYKNGKEIDTYHAFLKTNKKIPKQISEINHITDEIIEEKGRDRIVVLKEVLDFLENTIIIGHNAEEFDFKFLQNALKKSKLSELKNPVIDTLIVSREIYLRKNFESHALPNLADRLGVKFNKKEIHTAKKDVDLLINIWKKMGPKTNENSLAINDSQDLIYEKLFEKNNPKNQRMQKATIYAKNNSGLNSLSEIWSILITQEAHKEQALPISDLNQYIDDLIVVSAIDNYKLLNLAIENKFEELKKELKIFKYIFIGTPDYYESAVKSIYWKKEDIEAGIKNLINLCNQENKKLIISLSEKEIIKSFKNKKFCSIDEIKATFKNIDLKNVDFEELIIKNSELLLLEIQKNITIVKTDSQAILEGCNEEQKKAIETPNEHSVVIAGAGSGKTTVLIKRIVYLIEERKINPEKIWVITFTNKAINEVKKRIKKSATAVPKNIGTFHSSCVKILKRNNAIKKIGVKSNFLIADEERTYRLISEIISRDELIIPDRPQMLPTMISWIKTNTYPNSKISEETFVDLKRNYDYSTDNFVLQQLYTKYQFELQKHDLVDFDDLLLLTKKLFDEVPEEAEYWEDFYDAILIDEFQDINELQFYIIQKILGKKKNIFCVGDPDQSIYGFRGAKPKIFEIFKSIYRSTREYKLEQNYRSTKKILNVANHLIQKNVSPFTKTLFSKNESGSDIEYFYSNKRIEEAEWIVKKIKELKEKDKVDLSEILVLYRNNYFSSGVEGQLKKENIKYITSENAENFEDIEVQEMVCWLSLIFFDDEFSLRKIFAINDGALGESTFQKLIDSAKEENIDFFKFFLKINQKTKIKTSIEKLENIILTVNAIKEIRKELKKNDLIINIVQTIMKITKPISSRMKRNKRLIRLFERINYVLYLTKKDMKIEDAISQMLIYVKSCDNEYVEDVVNLSTIHKAKGCEFKYVFVIKMTQFALPSRYIRTNPILIEEERRLAYVAFTRAKKKLFLSTSPIMVKKKKHIEKSQFIKEIEKLEEFSYKNIT